MAETLTYKPKPLKPITDPRELRERTVRDYKRNAERMGLNPSVADLEKLAIADLQTVDLFKQGVDITKPKGKRKRKKDRVKEQSLLVDPNEPMQPRLMRDERPVFDRPDVLYAPAPKLGEKWSYAMGRVARIMQGTSAHADARVACSTAEMPDLALEITRLFSDFLVGRRRVSKHNPFQSSPGHVLSERDASRKFMTMIYDICDRSTKKLGFWYIK